MTNIHTLGSVSEEQRDYAITATKKMLVAIDIKRVDELRKQLDLAPNMLGPILEIYAGFLAIKTSADAAAAKEADKPKAP